MLKYMNDAHVLVCVGTIYDKIDQEDKHLQANKVMPTIDCSSQDIIRYIYYGISILRFATIQKLQSTLMASIWSLTW